VTDQATTATSERVPYTHRMRTDDVTTYQALYGNETGHFAWLTAEVGTTPPPRIDDLVYLGSPIDVVTQVVRDRMGPGRPRVQQEISELLGVSQQTVSRYINGRTRPDLTTAGWRNLVRLAFGWEPPDNGSSSEVAS